MNSTALLIRLEQARNHFSHHSHFFEDFVITGNYNLDQYLNALLFTYIFAFVIYFSLSTVSYLVFYKIWKQRFTPDKVSLQGY